MIIKTYGSLVYEIYRENGKKIVRKISDFQPYFFVKENEESLKDHRIVKEEYGEYYSIFGDKLKKIIARRPFYIRQLREYYTDTFEGDVLYRNRYLIDRVDHNKHNYEYRICYIDIECDAREGFPHPEEAKYPITVMTCYDTILKKYFVFTWRQDQKDRIEKTEERTTYFFNKEKDMLEMFIRYLRHTWPEIITGWNVINFDFHYIINRMKKLHVNPMKMSRFNWVKLNKFDDNISISIDGIDLIDLMKVYIKFQYIKAFNPSKKLESYSLKAVSEYEELGQKYQLDDDMSLADMWVKDLNKTIEYNQRDVELLLAIEDKLKLFNFMNEIKKMGFCSMEDVMTSSRLIDNYILKYAKDNNIILPTANRFVDNEKYEGAEIYTKGVGLVKNVAGFDFKSMYPSIMITFNTSPEVKNIEGNNIEVNNVKFSLDKEGFASKIVKNLIAERYKWKKERNKLKFNSIEYLAAYDKETSIKTIVNSFYGVFGYTNFRLYDRDIASTITYVGRNLFKVSKKVCEELGYEVVYGHTDSVMVKLPDDFSIETCIEKAKELQDKINERVKKYTEKFGITNNFIEIDFEKFFKSAVFTEAEARYFALLVHDGDKFIEPVVRITGFEGIKRDTPLYMRKFLVNFYRKVLDLKTKEELRDYIKDTIKNCKKQDLMDIGFTIRIAKKLEEYEGNAYHVRAAKYSNKYLGTHFKRTDYIKIMYVKNKDKQVPETDIVAFDLGSQKTMLNHFKIDWAKQLDRIMFMKIDQVCKIINLNVEDIRQKIRGQSNLGDYT